MSVCIKDNLSNATALSSYRLPIVNQHQQKALLIYAKMLYLAGGGGTDYTSNFPALFRNTAAALDGTTADTVRAAMIDLYFSQAAGVTTVPPTISGKLNNIAPLLAQPDSFLDAINVFLQCAIFSGE